MPAPCCRPGRHIRAWDHLPLVSRGVKCSAPIKARAAAGWGLGTCLKGSETLWKEPRSAPIPGFALELFNLSFKMPWARLRVCQGESTYDSQSQDE